MNPAIDRTIAVNRLAFDDRAYFLSSKYPLAGATSRNTVFSREPFLNTLRLRL
jgi:hypothetical protein